MIYGTTRLTGIGYGGPRSRDFARWRHRLVLLTLLAFLPLSAANALDAPTIAYFTPTGGPEGTLVTLYGTNFDAAAPANNQLTLNGTSVEILRVLPEEIAFTVPTGAATGLLAVTTTAGGASSTEPFLVSPLTLSIAPTSASVAVGKTRAFTATVSGGTSSDVHWHVNDVDGGNDTVGTIEQTNPATYHAPADVPSPAQVRVAAVSTADARVRAVAVVKVFSLAAGVPDIRLGPLDPATFSLDPNIGLQTSRTRVMVMLQDGASANAIASVVSAVNGQVTAGFPEIGAMVVEVPDTGALDLTRTAATILRGTPGVEVAVQDTLLEPTMVEPEPTDGMHVYADENATIYNMPASKDAWSWEVSPYGYNWGLEYANFPQAWNWYHFLNQSPNRLVDVCVLDAGEVSRMHTDLDNVTVLASGAPHYHSTHVAGTIAATWGNRRGITGASPFVRRIYSMPSISSSASSAKATWYTSSAQEFMDSYWYVVRHTTGARLAVVNMSMAYNWFSNQFGSFNDINHNGVMEMLDLDSNGSRETSEWASRWSWNINYLVSNGRITSRVLTDCTATPQYEQAQRDTVAYQGAIALRLVNRNDTIFVAAAGNDRHDLKGMLTWSGFGDNTAATPGASARRDTWWDQNFRAEFSSPFCWAAYHGATNVLVVEALKPRGNRDLIERADFSNRAVADGGSATDPGQPIPYGVSAPGVDILSTHVHDDAFIPPAPLPFPDTVGYVMLSGTSMAAPHVSGLVAYLRSIDRVIHAGGAGDAFFTNDEIVRLIHNSGHSDASGGSPTAAPAIDAFAAVKRIDDLRATHGQSDHLMKRILLNVDDGTVDGNDRNQPDADDRHGSVFDKNGDGVIQADEIKIDMSDFRRFRDACLIVKNRGGALDGPATSLKRDLNGDLVFDTPAKENVYPRCDFNGDGEIHVAGAADKNDLDTMADVTIWQDDDVKAGTDEELRGKLSNLIYSGDLKIDAEGLFTGDIDKIKIFASFVDASGTKEVYSIKLGKDDVLVTPPAPAPPVDRRKILTAPSKRQFQLHARAYAGDVFRKFLLAEGGMTISPLQDGEDRLINLRLARVVPAVPNFAIEPGARAEVGLALALPDGSRYAIAPDLFTVNWTVPPDSGTIATTSTGWNYTAPADTGPVELRAEVTLDGEPVNWSDEPYAATEAMVTSGTIKSPAGLAVDKAGNMYISDADEGTIVMVPPKSKGFVLLRDLNKPGDVELSSNGHALVIAEANGKISKYVFGVSGRVKDLEGDLLVGATVTGQTVITGTPGSGDTISRAKTDGNGWFHLFWLLEPPLGEHTADAVLTVEYRGRAQAYTITLGPEGQTMRDLTFDLVRLTMGQQGDGTTSPSTGFYDFERKTEVSIKATPAPGWQFERWSGIETTDNPATITLFNDMTVTAIFVPK